MICLFNFRTVLTVWYFLYLYLSILTFYRDLRLQRDLGVRYDTRDNVFDWDYHMRLVGREVILLSKHRGIWQLKEESCMSKIFISGILTHLYIPGVGSQKPFKNQKLYFKMRGLISPVFIQSEFAVHVEIGKVISTSNLFIPLQSVLFVECCQ